MMPNSILKHIDFGAAFKIYLNEKSKSDIYCRRFI